MFKSTLKLGYYSKPRFRLIVIQAYMYKDNKSAIAILVSVKTLRANNYFGSRAQTIIMPQGNIGTLNMILWTCIFIIKTKHQAKKKYI